VSLSVSSAKHVHVCVSPLSSIFINLPVWETQMRFLVVRYYVCAGKKAKSKIVFHLSSYWRRKKDMKDMINATQHNGGYVCENRA
jgi:hypothetical protein